MLRKYRCRLSDDIFLAQQIRQATRLPMTVQGGAGSLADIGSLLHCCGVVGAAAGSLLVFKGAFRAVLINYQSQAQKQYFMRTNLPQLTHS